MHCLRKRILLSALTPLAVFLLAFATLGCEKKGQEAEARTLSLRVVHGPELRAFMGYVKEKFYLEKHRLGDGSRLQLEPIVDLNIDAAKRIAYGDLKTEAWIAPSTTLVNFANAQLRNLGPPQTACTPLFATPIVFAVRADQAAQLEATNQRFSWKKLTPRWQALYDSNEASESLKAPLLNHGHPLASISGAAAFIQLAYFASNPFDQLTPASIGQPSFIEGLGTLQSHVRRYGASESVLLNKVATTNDGRLRVMITTEQQLVLFNVDNEGRVPKLLALYPEEGSYWEDYQLCISSAGWVSGAHIAGLHVLADFLKATPAQAEALRKGFRSITGKIAAQKPLLPPYGANTALPERHLPPLKGETVMKLMSHWKSVARPSAQVLVLDTSGSMEGVPIEAAKAALRRVLAVDDERSLKGLVTFTATPRVDAALTNRSSSIIPLIDPLTALGGSAIYDSIKEAVSLLSDKKLRPYRKSVVLITDGSDKNSSATLEELLAMLKRDAPLLDLEITIIGLEHARADFSDMEQIAQATGGTFRPTDLGQLEAVLKETVATS